MPEKKQPLCVGRDETGQKLLRFLERKLRATPQDLHKWLRTGQIRCNGKRIKPFDRLEQGDLIRIPPQAVILERFVPAAQNVRLSIIHEDADLLVLNKPAGLPTQGGSGHSQSLTSQLASVYAEADYLPAPAHRLDKETSGLVLAAKNHLTARRLADLFANKSGDAIRKDYLAWVHGRLKPGVSLKLEDLLGKDQKTGKVLVWHGSPTQTPNRFKAAQATATCLHTIEAPDGGSACLLQLALLSGRTHQLRVQLACRNLPIVGDPKYGLTSDLGIGLKLHAWRIGLPDGQTFCLLPDWSAPWQIDPERGLSLPSGHPG